MNETGGQVDKELPYFFDNDVENHLLGICLIDGTTVTFFRAKGVNESWFSLINAPIWKSICEVDDLGQDVDVVSITMNLQGKGELDRVGGGVRIAQLAGDVVTASYSEPVVALLAENVRLRRLWMLLDKTRVILCERPAESIRTITYLRGQSEEIESLMEDEPDTLESLYGDVIRSYANIDGHEKLFTGLERLDEKLGGLYLADSTIVAGESSIGKTSLLCDILRHINKKMGHPVLLFSLEMDGLIIAMRCLSADSHIRLTDIRDGRASLETVMRAIEAHRSSSFFIDHDTWTLDEIESRTRYFVQKFGVKVMALDYIQLAEANLRGNRNREQEVSHIGARLKKIAKMCNIHTFGISQLDDNWRYKGGKNPRPTGANLRESKALKHHTDNLLICYTSPNNPQEVRITIDKARNSATGDLGLGFIGSQTRFVNSPGEVPRTRPGF